MEKRKGYKIKLVDQVDVVTKEWVVWEVEHD